MLSRWSSLRRLNNCRNSTKKEMNKTIIATLMGFMSQKLFIKQYMSKTTKKSPKVCLIKPLFRKMAISASIRKSREKKKK